MKLVNYDYNLSFEIDEDKSLVLCIENNEAFSSIVASLWKQNQGEDGAFILSEDNKALRIDKTVDVIINPYNIDFNSRKIRNALYKSLNEKTISYDEEKSSINFLIVYLLDELVLSEQVAGIEYEVDFDWEALFKLYDVRINGEYSTLVEKFTEYIKVLSALTDIRVLCLVNVDSFIDDEKVNYLIKQASYSKISLLFVTSNEKAYPECINKCILDKDLCLIYK